MNAELEAEVALAKRLFDDGVPDVSLPEAKSGQIWQLEEDPPVRLLEEVWPEQGLWAVELVGGSRAGAVFISESMRDFWVMVVDVEEAA